MTVVRTEKRERSFAGKLIKWTFIGFNILMAVWIVGGLNSVSKIPTHSAAEQLGAGIGTTIAVTMILVLWALGDLILGVLVLVTRGNKVIIEESSAYGAQPRSSNSQFSYDLDRIDQRIAQAKAESASVPTGTTGAAPASPGFGRRRA